MPEDLCKLKESCLQRSYVLYLKNSIIKQLCNSFMGNVVNKENPHSIPISANNYHYEKQHIEMARSFGENGRE